MKIELSCGKFSNFKFYFEAKFSSFDLSNLEQYEKASRLNSITKVNKFQSSISSRPHSKEKYIKKFPRKKKNSIKPQKQTESRANIIWEEKKVTEWEKDKQLRISQEQTIILSIWYILILTPSWPRFLPRLTFFSPLISILPPAKPLLSLSLARTQIRIVKNEIIMWEMIYIGLKVRNKLIFIVWCDDESSVHKSLKAYPSLWLILYDYAVISAMFDLSFRMKAKNCFHYMQFIDIKYDARSHAELNLRGISKGLDTNFYDLNLNF